MSDEAQQKLYAAIVAAQAEMPHPPRKSTNPHLRNKFADLLTVQDTTRPVLAKHGLAIIQLPIGSDGQVGVVTAVVHQEGGLLLEKITLPLSGQKGLNTPQEAGSIITYLKRYAWSAVCGIASEPDDDGNEDKPKRRKAGDEPETTDTDDLDQF